MAEPISSHEMPYGGWTRNVMKVPGRFDIIVTCLLPGWDAFGREIKENWMVQVGQDTDEIYTVVMQRTYEEAVDAMESFLQEVQNALIDLKDRTPNEVWVPHKAKE